MKDDTLIRFLYNTVFGRFLLKIVVRPEFSQRAATFLSSTASAPLVPYYIKKHHLDMSYYYVPDSGFRSFNDFFTRKMKKEFIIRDDSGFCCPCEGLLTVSKISDESIFNIKHTSYSLRSMLLDTELADSFTGGTAYIFRLTPSHYHRYIYCTGGSITRLRKIKGKLNSVRPICHDKKDVFIENSREYTVINNGQLGDVVQMEVGALLVGKISNHKSDINILVTAGSEKGYFEYGGSSIVVITKKDFPLSNDMLSRFRYGDEIPVMIGESLTDVHIEKDTI